MADIVERQDADDILSELSGLQSWCFCMAAKDSGGSPAGDLVQRARIAIIEMRQDANALRAQVAALKTRLERDDPDFDRDDLDGIACRDETIKGQDAAIERLRARVAELTRERDEAREALARYASLYGVKQPQSGGIAVAKDGTLYNAQAIAAGEHRP